MNTLDVAEVARLAEAGEIVLVDVREDHEWQAARIPGAVHAPLSRFAEAVREIPEGRPVVFYCLVGGRSAQAVDFARALGLDHDTHMGGGIKAWHEQGLPIER
jgi:Rhodanese-related sulfurtransferase